ncbi:lysophospholipid acyltransferase family protein [Brevibacterium atlanticum]|uniref:glycerol acyltransferase n=1 Tax=Brevibacterium atlanticum TaxID=2697563 RepID=UPI001422E300|nr:glycerol acyltransferase [Brevibacterium atlanticum]
MSDASLGLRHRIINAAMRTVYFGRVRVLDLSGSQDGQAPPSPTRRPRLIIASHRNGAIDGHQVLAAFPRAQFLVSIQLLRHWFLRLFIAGIPVVRPKDVDRYGLDPASVASPVDAGLAHLRRGGDLGIFPEASSEWGHRPQPYKSGAARIACTLIDEGIDLEVIPVGLFYSTPDRFRSRAEVVHGPAVTLPSRDGRDRREWESAVASAMGSALDAVSVNCPDEATFERIEAEALERARRTPGRGASYAQTFLELQQAADSADGRDGAGTRAGNGRGGPTSANAGPAPRTYPLIRALGFALMWVFAPVLAAAGFAGSRADGRNTVTFFRLLAGFAAVMVWVPALIVAAVFWPAVIGAGVLSGMIGWLLLGMRRIRL